MARGFAFPRSPFVIGNGAAPNPRTEPLSVIARRRAAMRRALRAKERLLDFNNYHLNATPWKIPCLKAYLGHLALCYRGFSLKRETRETLSTGMLKKVDPTGCMKMR